MCKTLSVAIITQDEEANLGRTLSTMAWADEIVIVDSGSRDHTEEIARGYRARFFDEAWKGLAAQKNSALDKCTCNWVLALNSDEALSDGLAKEIRALLENESALDGYVIPRRTLFLGRWIRFGGCSRKPKLRMFRRGSAEFEPSRFRERLHFIGKAGLLKGYLAVYGYPTLYSYIEHMDSYSSVGAAVGKDPGARKPGILSFLSFMGGVLLRPMARFLYHYVLRLGFLDGREGLLLHIYHCIYMSWRYARTWEMSRDTGAGPSDLPQFRS